MEHPRIPAGITGGHIQFLFQHQDLQIVPGQFPGYGTAHHTGTNNNCIIQFHFPSLPSEQNTLGS